MSIYHVIVNYFFNKLNFILIINSLYSEFIKSGKNFINYINFIKLKHYKTFKFQRFITYNQHINGII
jgi:hypothetical protein